MKSLESYKVKMSLDLNFKVKWIEVKVVNRLIILLSLLNVGVDEYMDNWNEPYGFMSRMKEKNKSERNE